MELNFTPETQAKIDSAASESKKNAAQYVQQLVERYVDHDLWFRKQVKEGLDQLDNGEFLTHEQVGARIEQLFRS